MTRGRHLRSVHRKRFKLLTFLLLAGLLASPAEARRRPALRKIRHRPAPTLPIGFTPSPEIDARVQQEIAKASAALARLEPANLLANPYVVQAIYFHDGFLQDFTADRPDADPSLRISAQLCRAVTPEIKARFVAMLHDVYGDDLADVPSRGLQLPVSGLDSIGPASRYAHPDAVDLFLPEGSPVLAAAKGVVLLAESTWAEGDPFSTSTFKGGNTIITFDPETNRFYRYAHLERVLVTPGALVEAGQPIGAVGHTGLHASLPRHGRHLHFEVNQYDGTAVRVIDAGQLRAMLRDAQATQAAAVQPNSPPQP